MEKNLHEDSFIRRNVKKWITSVFPPTTVAATTAALSGISPGTSGWIGWHQYFKQINNDIVLFKNIGYYSQDSFNYNVADKYIPYEPFYKKIDNVYCKTLFPSFIPGGYSTFKEMSEEIIKISYLDFNTYAYCYWDNPDYTIHEFGIESKEAKEIINELNNYIEEIYNRCNDNTSIILIADHGLIDVEHIYLEDYPDFLDTLQIEPSIESRTTAFKVKDEDKFKYLFDKYFINKFDLYTSDNLIKEGFLGNFEIKNKDFLLDYISVAKDKYCFDLKRSDFVMKATHAGGTEDEMIIPLVILQK